jgi:hypothetical protein
MIFPVIGQRFVKFTIFFLCNIIWVSCPDWFSLIQFFIFSIFFFNCFLFIIFLLFFIIFVNILNFCCFLFTFFLGLLFYFVFTLNFLLAFFLNNKFNWITNKLRMFLYNFLNFALLAIFSLIFLQV